MFARTGEFTIEYCLQPQTMRALLQQSLPGFAEGGFTIERLRIVKARRNASRQRNPNPLTLCYELDVRNPVTGDITTQPFYGKVYRGGASATAARSTPTLHLPQLDMLLWPWPADPGLPQLPQLLDTRSALAWQGKLVGHVDVLHYEPEQRATLRYTLASNGPGPQALFAKTFSDERGALIHRRFEYFWSLAQQDDAAPLVAQPLAYHADTRTVWQAQAPGKPLAQALFDELPDRLARAIAAMHGAPMRPDTLHDSAHWLRETRRRQAKIARALPELAVRAARLADAIEQAAATLPAPVLTLIHGDFHPGQVWVDGKRIVLFDFDEFAVGDPMEDLAAFVTRLPGGGLPTELGKPMLSAYAQLAPERFCPRRLRWHLAVQQLLQASRAFVFQLPDWRLEVECRIERAQALCEPATMETLA